MKTNLSRYEFERAFVGAEREDQFSHDALSLLFAYFEGYEQNTNEKIEAAFSREYCEDTWQSIAHAYGIDLNPNENEEEQKQQVYDFLEVETVVVGKTEDGFVYASF